MTRDNDSGCAGTIGIIFFVCLFIYFGVDSLLHGDERKLAAEKEEKEFVKSWGKQNIDYFKTFKCDDFYFTSKKFNIEKFYVFATWHKYDCDVHDFIKYDLKFKDDRNQNKQTQLINDANVLIWIKQIPGERVGSYGDGSRAILLDSEINFIDIKNKIIFKKIVVKGIGDPPKEIMKKGYTSPSKDIFFGTFDDNAISQAIESEL